MWRSNWPQASLSDIIWVVGTQQPIREQHSHSAEENNYRQEKSTKHWKHNCRTKLQTGIIRHAKSLKQNYLQYLSNKIERKVIIYMHISWEIWILIKTKFWRRKKSSWDKNNVQTGINFHQDFLWLSVMWLMCFFMSGNIQPEIWLLVIHHCFHK